MRILLCCINFSPELTGVGKYTGEMAQWLARRGHQVRVVTAPPYYPDWKVREGFINGWKKSVESAGAAKLTVFRCPLWVPDRPGGVTRLLHLASFALSSFPVLMRQLFWRPDLVWVVEPPLFCAPAAALLARLSGARAWLHIQDFEVDAAFELGLLKGGRLRAWVQGIERWLMRRFDVVATISQRMVARAASKGVAVSALRYFPNWVDLAPFATRSPDGALAYRRELGIPQYAVVALYSGNMGGKQGLEVLADAARICQRNRQLVFVFCGNGSGKADLVMRCQGLLNVHWLDLQPVERLPDLLSMADVHLLPQKADAADLVMPSKLTGMLASGRPVLATAREGTELASVVQHCGILIPPENPAAMAEALSALAGDSNLRQRLGAAGRDYAANHLDREVVLRQFEADLQALVARH